MRRVFLFVLVNDVRSFVALLTELNPKAGVGRVSGVMCFSHRGVCTLCGTTEVAAGAVVDCVKVGRKESIVVNFTFDR